MVYLIFLLLIFEVFMVMKDWLCLMYLRVWFRIIGLNMILLFIYSMLL